MRPAGHPNGLALDRQGRLVVAGWSARSIWRVQGDGSIVTLASHYQGKRINTPNDVVVADDDSVLWTDPSSALFTPGMEGDDLQRYLDFHGVFRFRPDGSVLYIYDTHRHHVRAFGVQPDRSLANDRLFYVLRGHEPGGADGLKTDVEGTSTSPGRPASTSSTGSATCWAGSTSPPT